MELREDWGLFLDRTFIDITEFLYIIRYQLMSNRNIPTHLIELKVRKFWETLCETKSKDFNTFEWDNIVAIEEFLCGLIRSGRLTGGKIYIDAI